MSSRVLVGGAAALVLLAACGSAPPVPIQVRNGGTVPLGQVTLSMSNATLKFGDVAPGAVSKRLFVVGATDCVAPSAVVQGQKAQIMLFDCVGAHPLDASLYTWVLQGTDPGRLTILGVDKGTQR